MCGSSDAGQLGTGKRERELLPKRIAENIGERISSAACGIFHTCLIGESGSLFAMGGNSYGQLGIGNKKGSLLPVRIKELNGVKIMKVSCRHHTAAISVDGELYFWGTSIFGEYLTPQKITGMSVKMKDISIGGCFGSGLDQNGKLWTWGSNSSGELGVGDYEPRKQPFPLEKLCSKTVVSISCGGSYAIALGVTHSVGAPSDRSRTIERMESVITHVLNKSSRDSQDSLDSPPKDNTEAQQIPNENSKSNIEEGKTLISDKAEIQESNFESENVDKKNIPPIGISQNQRNISENRPDLASASEYNTVDIGSSVSQRDPHQPVNQKYIIYWIKLVISRIDEAERLFGRESRKGTKREEVSPRRNLKAPGRDPKY